MIICILPEYLENMDGTLEEEKVGAHVGQLPGFSHSQDAPQRAVITPAAVFFSVCEFSYL